MQKVYVYQASKLSRNERGPPLCGIASYQLLPGQAWPFKGHQRRLKTATAAKRCRRMSWANLQKPARFARL